MDRIVVIPRDYQMSKSPLSPAIRAGGLLFVSGQIAPESEGVEAQTSAVLDKIRTIVRAAGTDLHAVVRCGVYLADIRTFAEMNSAYRTYFAKDAPARTTIECKLADPRVLVEIDCVAMV